jgi:hypothetical protein
MVALSTITDNWMASHDAPVRIAVLLKDLIAYKKAVSHMVTNDVTKKVRKEGDSMTIYYHRNRDAVFA